MAHKRGRSRPRAAQDPALRNAAALGLIAPLLWPLQAGVLAFSLAQVIAGNALPVWAAPAFLGIALLRALGDSMARARAQGAARRLVTALRHQALHRLARNAPGAEAEDAAAQASLIGEKLARLAPWAELWLPAMMRARVVPVVILLLVASQSWTAALALLVTGPLIPLFMALIGHAAQSVSRAQLVEVGALNRLLIDRIAALHDIRLLGALSLAEEDLAGRSTALRERTMKVLRLAFLSSTVLEFLAALGVAMIALQSGLSLLGLVSWGGWGGTLTPFSAIFILLLAPDFYQPLREIASVWHDRANAEAVLDELADAENAPVPQILGGLEAANDPAATGPLIWQDLHLGLAGRRLTLGSGRLDPGEAVALMAPSGAGKSSLLAALAGLRAVQGRISLGETELTEASASRVRASLGWLPQQPRFPAQRLGPWLTAGREVAPEALAKALKAARADGILAALPLGFATTLGESGGGVSGGEARRLMIARAILDPPAILLADEPTADLDPETAAEVTAALLALRASGTALLVATHDPALAAAMDRRITLPEAAS